MRRRISIAIVAACIALLAVPSSWSAEAPRAKETSYTVLSRTGGVVRVSALEWIPPRAKTVLLALHGIGAVKENSWGPLVVPGYSFALNQYKEGRATVAIDFPGNGGSEGDPYLGGVEDNAFVVDQIVDLLRARFDRVVGVGHSLGALTSIVTQGLFESFDAIVPAAYSHGGNSEAFNAACRPPNTPGTGTCPRSAKLLFTSYADRRVVEDFMWRTRAPKATQGLNLWVYFGPPAGPHVAPTGDDLSAAVEVPVLSILAGDDFLWDTSKYAEESSHYPNAPDVKVVVVPKAGHAVFHHLNYGYVNAVIGKWLTKQKL